MLKISHLSYSTNIIHSKYEDYKKRIKIKDNLKY